MTSATFPQRGREAWLHFFRSFALVAAINVFIGIFITAIRGSGLWENIVVSEAIGLSICLMNVLAVWYRDFQRVPLWMLALTVVSGALAGIFISGFLLDHTLALIMIEQPRVLLIVLANVVLFGTVVTYYFESRRHIAATSAQLQAEQLRNAQSAHQLAEVQLKLLQAQIEPHFLFNTLSNVLSLIDPAPAQAKAMLEHLTRYLRVGLQRTRNGTSTLAEEVDLLRAYLEIQTIRMGERLHYRIQDPGALAQVPIPPLLIQPLVENAVIHGLAPQISGGRIDIQFRRDADRISIVVADTGRGLNGDWGGGVGLKNIRDRLAGLYGDQAQLTLRQNAPTGVVATLSLPLTTEDQPSTGAPSRRP